MTPLLPLRRCWRSSRNSGINTGKSLEEANQDFKEFVEYLRSRQADFLLIGAHALALHGYPRFTGDLDVWIRTTPDNLERVRSAIADFEVTLPAEGPGPWLGPNEVPQIGVYPYRIDVLASIRGVTVDEAWNSRVPGGFLGVPVHFIPRDHLTQNKKVSGRKKHLGDIDELESRTS